MKDHKYNSHGGLFYDDKVYLNHIIGKDPIGFKADWRNMEKILENEFTDVLLFQRGRKEINREYPTPWP